MIETSIIIPVRNQKGSLLAALNSLRRQIKKPRDFEIVVCDDDSSDGTGDAVKRLRYPIFFKYFINTPPLGRAANRNRGVERSAGKRLIFFDGDMVPDDCYVESILDGWDPASVKVGHARPPLDEKLDGLGLYLYSRGRYIYKDMNKNLPGKFFTSNNFLIARANFEKLGGFDTRFSGWGGEDIDFGLRLEQAGIPILNAYDSITFHYHKRELASMMADFYEFGQTSFAYLLEKHPQFASQIKAGFLGIKRSGGAGCCLKLISRLTANALTLKAASRILSLSDNIRWPDFLYDYVLWGSLARGYRKKR